MSAPNPSTDEKDRVVHEIDGIEEYDNQLPRWWLYSLYLTMVFAAGYWFVYHSGGFADQPLQIYQAELQKKAKSTGTVSPELLAALANDPAVVEKGKQVFTSTCVACHRNDGGGSVGPNLTDDYWLHGGTPDKIFKTVSEGVPDKGMPSWKPQLGDERVQAVTAYVLTLKGKNVPGGKPPQGTRDGTLSQNP
jgi:cytochrome c oxidase cbb3-type subunit 3